MRRRSTLLTLLILMAFPAGTCLAQSNETGARKVIERVAPAYPSVALNMHITGIVRVEAKVSPTGSVKSIEIKGGHPLLAQAAAEAVSKWKWVPATHETEEPVEVKFGPQTSD